MKAYETCKKCSCSPTPMYWFSSDPVFKKAGLNGFYPVWCMECRKSARMIEKEDPVKNFTGFWKDFVSHPSTLDK